MGIADDNICCSENNILDAILKVAEALMFDDAELISIYFGIDVSKDAVEFTAGLTQRFLLSVAMALPLLSSNS